MFEWIFAFFHFFLFLGLVTYSIFALARGNWFTGLILLVFLTAYYFIVLHPAVLKEIRRKKKKGGLKNKKRPR
ncbi:MAG: hypothetical protein H5U06_04420 [Candidatus Aminicenantes bacterium]|nr:hypothetical protein [Candidatus Aminicenantes bacterium]